MTNIDTRPRSPNTFALDVVPAPVTSQALAPAQVVLPVATPTPSIFNRETATHALLGIAQVGAIGGLAYMATSSVTLVAAALAGAVATGVAIAKAVASRSTNGQAAAALEADRRALGATRDLLVQQSSAIASDRGRLDAELAHVQSERQHLAGERENIAERITSEANRLIVTEKQALTQERAVFEERVAAFEARVQQGQTPLQAEAAALTVAEIQAIKAAAAAYCNNAAPYYRFAAVAYGSGQIVPNEKVMNGENALATLIGTGQLVAGACTQYGDNWVIPRAGATVFTSVHQLRTYLRAATGQDV